MNIISQLGEAIRTLQATLGIELQDADFRPENREEILHILIHETCHAAISQSASWVHELPDTHHTAVDEIAARVLETEIANQLQLHAHSVESHSRELSLYGLDVVPTTLDAFFNAWAKLPRSPNGIEQLCRLIHNTLFETT